MLALDEHGGLPAVVLEVEKVTVEGDLHALDVAYLVGVGSLGLQGGVVGILDDGLAVEGREGGNVHGSCPH